jgi:hypothetical protein
MKARMPESMPTILSSLTAFVVMDLRFATPSLGSRAPAGVKPKRLRFGEGKSALAPE